MAKAYPVNIALHTDHCPKDKLDGYMRPLIKISQERVAAGREPLFQSHMWDGSAVELEENLKIARELLEECAKAKIVMELEIGVVGGEEDGVANEINEKLYTTPGDAVRTVEVLGAPGEVGRYLLAATFGNVHGVYKPGNVKLRPSILKDIQDEVGAKLGADKPFDAGVPRRLGLGPVRHPRDPRLRRREDERRHRHAVRVHPAGRGPHVHQLRRRAQDRRRGRQQEAVRPAGLGQGCRGRHGRPRRSRPARTSAPPAPSAVTRARRHESAPEPARGDRRHVLPDEAGPREALAAGTRRRRSPPPTPPRAQAWATLAEAALADGRTIEGYAYARTGYHRGLDALRRNGWKGHGPVPWEHEPNRGFLRALHALGQAAAAIHEDAEAARCEQFLADSSPTAARELA